MQVNPVLNRLGFARSDRVVIFHADDIGMCQASLAAYAEVVAFGLVSSAATMVPCPWFPAMATYCREQPNGHVDMGVHLTLTSEWEHFRWRPLATHELASGLLDDDGYLHRLAAPVQAGGDPSAVLREMVYQMERARAAGIDVTHVDSHMFTLFHPRLLPAYFSLAFRYQVPATMVRGNAQFQRLGSFDHEAVEALARLVRAAEAAGMPLLDDIYVMPLSPLADRLAFATEVLQSLRPGITCFVIHPAHDTPELRAMTPDWQARVGDFELFTSEAWAQAIRRSGVHVIGFRPLRKLMRATKAVPIKHKKADDVNHEQIFPGRRHWQ